MSAWEVSNVARFTRMFEGASVFSSDLSAGDVGNTVGMQRMFVNTHAFDSDLSEWNMARVSKMIDTGKIYAVHKMFTHADAFQYWQRMHHGVVL